MARPGPGQRTMLTGTLARWGCYAMLGDPEPVVTVIVGNAKDAASTRGWFVGHFLEPDGDVRRTSALEVKWGIHAEGEHRGAWAVSHAATTLSILLKGRFHYQFSGGREVLLVREGDYVIWPPGVAHVWEAKEASVVLTVRWPSTAGDARNLV